MPDQREEEMLALMQEATQILRQAQNTISEIWAEWTRTHGLKGIRGPEDAKAAAYGGDVGPRRKVVRRG